MNFDIREAIAAEAELIADMSRQTFYESFASQNAPEDMDQFMNNVFTREALMKEVGAPGNIFLLAFLNEEAVGYVRMRDGMKHHEFANRSSIEIARIYTLQHSIGKGAGSALMQKCLEIAKEMNRQVIWLGVWEHNHQAIRFYTKWGFEKFSEHDFVLGSDVQRDWLMKKEL
ncbi:MAG: GNAT family N-acetyltransferase [Chitinophagaceae bacterium]|nr:GNAT family N-acetyltransferase [Chitinophagaceae bacterium]